MEAETSGSQNERDGGAKFAIVLYRRNQDDGQGGGSWSVEGEFGIKSSV